MSNPYVKLRAMLGNKPPIIGTVLSTADGSFRVRGDDGRQFLVTSSLSLQPGDRVQVYGREARGILPDLPTIDIDV